jgi:hypothetical protein
MAKTSTRTSPSEPPTANAALGNIWAVLTSDADHNNIILAAPPETYLP